MARKRTGQLIWRPTMGWCVRLSVWEEGERVRKMVELGTRSRPVARRKLRRLLEQDDDRPVEEAAATALTLREAADLTLEQ